MEETPSKVTLDRDFTELSQQDLKEGELFFGLPAALIVVVLVFGAVVAGLVPVLLALVSILVAVALTALVGQAYELSFFVVNMISGMGLALGIDYALFVVSRYREERRQGREKLDAIEAAGSRQAAQSSSAAWPSLLPCSAWCSCRTRSCAAWRWVRSSSARYP